MRDLTNPTTSVAINKYKFTGLFINTTGTKAITITFDKGYDSGGFQRVTSHVVRIEQDQMLMDGDIVKHSSGNPAPLPVANPYGFFINKIINWDAPTDGTLDDYIETILNSEFGV